MFGLKKSIVAIKISPAAYDEIAAMIVADTDANGVIDMTGYGLAREPETEPVAPVHRPIAPTPERVRPNNKAPGAI